MSEVFRLCIDPYTGLDGEGASLYGGRWNSRGNAVIYTSENLALAVLEYLVHVAPDILPDNLVYLRIRIPDDASKELFPELVAPAEEQAARFGNDWIKRNQALLFIVPSAVVPESNILINPRHSEMQRVTVVSKQPFKFNPRLFRR